MSVIVIVLDEVPSAKNLLSFQRLFNVSLQSIKSACSAAHPLLEIEIFDGDYQAHADLIRSVLKVVKDENLKADFYELPFGLNYSQDADIQKFKINLRNVEQILEATDEEFERQQDSEF
ncbi:MULTISPECIES: hypothetical protein [Pseudomonas]|uniref:Uncharacterized protein n=1 Tax=Pseudomonas quercus TaxID=2722792 RepID=A0ABX0YD32_9PSED|nr:MULTISPECIES: hypothetical protein [Pseudomonas]MBF7142697.1 hypothetical protein [Pseudomonas sp. LY10J]NJP01235.1 hypothetical protein [Pseudomonas quercus]